MSTQVQMEDIRVERIEQGPPLDEFTDSLKYFFKLGGSLSAPKVQFRTDQGIRRVVISSARLCFDAGAMSIVFTAEEIGRSYEGDYNARGRRGNLVSIH